MTRDNLTTDERAAIIEEANARGFKVDFMHGGPADGRLMGYALDTPRVATWFGSFDISWDLAYRLANGTATRVLA